MPGEIDQPLDEVPATGDDEVASSLPSEDVPRPEPDGDVRFVPGAEVPLPPPPDDAPRCSWCSAAIADPAAPTCPSCGAQLNASEPVDVPGLTAVDPVLLALANRPKPERRGLASWLAGDAIDEYPLPTQAELAALAPPDAAVRREMRRLELAAMGIVVADEPIADEPDEPAPAEPEQAAAEPGDADHAGIARVEPVEPGAEPGPAARGTSPTPG
ncbi:MAG: hypothetical protein H6Q36_1046 [Chloroflexi bacterium]|nr:hypothetical protein [Chloroflexota bacterium]